MRLIEVMKEVWHGSNVSPKLPTKSNMLITCLGDASWGLVLGAKTQPDYEEKSDPLTS